MSIQDISAGQRSSVSQSLSSLTILSSFSETVHGERVKISDSFSQVSRSYLSASNVMALWTFHFCGLLGTSLPQWHFFPTMFHKVFQSLPSLIFMLTSHWCGKLHREKELSGTWVHVLPPGPSPLIVGDRFSCDFCVAYWHKFLF